LTFSLNFTVSGILVVCENLLSQIVVYFPLWTLFYVCACRTLN
jgi:hypothetical protein